jgi:hypothetical protein
LFSVGSSSAAAAADDNRPSASGSGTFASGGATTTNVQTDFDAMNDAVGIAGVDIAVSDSILWLLLVRRSWRS